MQQSITKRFAKTFIPFCMMHTEKNLVGAGQMRKTLGQVTKQANRNPRLTKLISKKVLFKLIFLKNSLIDFSNWLISYEMSFLQPNLFEGHMPAKYRPFLVHLREHKTDWNSLNQHDLIKIPGLRLLCFPCFLSTSLFILIESQQKLSLYESSWKRWR